LPWLTDYGFELSRGFYALKAWMTLKVHGTQKYGRLIQQNIDQAHYLAGLVEAAPELELALPVSLNVVNFRYTRPGIDDAGLDRLNKTSRSSSGARYRCAFDRQPVGKLPASPLPVSQPPGRL
jgi:glutamate/tyrosine decarboxylase-like PLP-dependent enzyme